MKESVIADLVSNHLAGSDKFLVEVLIKPVNRIYIFIDGDRGVMVHDCVELSRFLESQFDREQQDFELNVSSAGADQPIRLHRQYLKNIGRSIHVKLAEDQELKGKLLRVGDRGITLETSADKKNKIPQAERYLDFEMIKEAKVILLFK